MKTIKKLVLLFSLAVVFVSCNPWSDDTRLINPNVGKTLKEVMKDNHEVSKFAEILKLTGYADSLENVHSFTVFAPQNSVIDTVSLDDVEYLKKWVKNYISMLAYYVDKNGHFTTADSLVELINGKFVPLGISSVAGSDIVKSNILSANGVLHIIDNIIVERQNILTYLRSLSGYAQIDYIQSADERVMDKERSVQKGVNMNGQPVYDTVWTVKNTFLEKYPLANEKKNFTFILVDQDALNTLTYKYSRYMYQLDTAAWKRGVIREVTSDLVLKKVRITTAGRFPNIDDILVDIDPENIIKTYQASNGFVYHVKSAGVKFYENKIKEIKIEAEDYTTRWDEKDAFAVRSRSWASGGKDVMLKGYTNWRFDYTYTVPASDGSDSIVYGNRLSSTVVIQDRNNDPLISRGYNAYLEYNPVLYSTNYEIYWLSYDDIPSSNHTRQRVPPDSLNLYLPLVLQQKLMISFAGAKKLERYSNGIFNNFSQVTCFAAQDTAGIMKERKLIRYRRLDSNRDGANFANLFVLREPYLPEDSFGQGSLLKCPTYGAATFFVANTTRDEGLNYTNVNSRYPGLIFLDYLRIVPIVNPND